MGTIKTAQSAMGYQPAGQRDGCRNCVSGEEQREERMPPWDKPYWRCNAGGFRTSAMAICNQHKQKKGAVHG